MKTIKELAIFMHNTYEELSKKLSWKTQESCKVEFDKLPNKNKHVMLGVATAVLKDFKKDVLELIDEIHTNNKVGLAIIKEIKKRIEG